MSKDIKDITIYELKDLIEKYSNARFKEKKDGGFVACCPFHKEKTPSFSLADEGNHARYKCFGCKESGDAIDFLEKYAHKSEVDAMLELGLDVDERTKQQLIELDKVKKSAEWLVNNNDSLKGYKPVEFYPFKDLEGNVIRYEVKFRNKQGDKQPRPCRIDEKGKTRFNLQGVEDVPYNLHLAAREIKKDKPIIFIVEGPKDCETVAHELGYVALSFKNLNHSELNKFDYSIFNNSSIYLLGDTGKAGQKYIEEMREIFFNHSKGLYIVELPELEAMGDNKDVTDWLEAGHNAGHNKEEFQRACKDAWNYKKSQLWKYTKTVKRNGEEIVIPLKVTENLEMLLKREGISVKYNEINKEIEIKGISNYGRNAALTSILDLQTRRGLGMSKDQVDDSLNLIAHKHSYNPFVEYLKENEVKNLQDYELENIIADTFDCLTINQEYEQEGVFYYKLFKRWLLGVVKMAHNTLENKYQADGVLVLQGEQGIRKSTFIKNLLPCGEWFKGDMSINPDNKDSILQNTKYILVELGELDSTMKQEQAKLKAYITTSNDDIRPPYARKSENTPRITTYAGTVNIKDFIKDRTGSRRWWVIPVIGCNIEKLQSIDKAKLWGSLYHIWKEGKEITYLTDVEREHLEKLNMDFKATSDISLILDDSIDWDKPYTMGYKITEIATYLEIRDITALRNELERRGFNKESIRPIVGAPFYGYKLPKIKGSSDRIGKELKKVVFHS